MVASGLILPKGVAKPKTIVIIPARLDSKRLPRKPMLMAGGKPLVHHVYDRAKRTIADNVIVTSPDKEICQYCQLNRLTWFPSSVDNPTGTHRCAEVLSRMKCEIDLVVNWQVDEATLEPADVDELIRLHRVMGSVAVMTIAAPLDPDLAEDENVVKAIVLQGEARWFSRAPMRAAMGHCGIYSFKRSTLEAVGQWNPTIHSRVESLEQLAWIEHSLPILVHRIDGLPLAINTESDYRTWKGLVEGT